MRCILLLVLMFGGFVSALPLEVYNTDFENGIDAVWSNSNLANDTNVGNYHGNFSTTGNTTLTLTGLPTHTQLSLEFGLYLFATWDGENTQYGKDYFSLSGDVNGAWTFTNHQLQGQSYPGSPNEVYGSGAWATHVYRGLDPTGTGDEFLVSHSGNIFSVIFGGPTTQSDEWWGIDNVRVSIDNIPEPGSLFLFGISLLGLVGLRKRKIKGIVFVAIFSLISGSAFATYIGYDTWYDTNKSSSNSEDDSMCWAAAASNILYWGDWNTPVYSSEDAVWQHFQNHWTDKGSIMEFGWNWWLNGTLPPDWPNWSQVDVPGGVPLDGFWPDHSFNNYYHREWNDSLAMSAIDGYIQANYGVTLGVYGPGGHAITLWGYEYDGDYQGIYITDSDNTKNLANWNQKILSYYDVSYSGSRWYLQNFYDSNDWYIGEVQALGQHPISAIPEPNALFLFGISLLGLARFRFKKKVKR